MIPRQSIFAIASLGAILWLMCTPPAARCEEEEKVSMRDNSFLIEEAYNQEKGIVQNIFNWVPSWDVNRGTRNRGMDFVFTQEWPVFSQTHQFSYSIPYSRFTEQAPGGPIFESEGIGDIMLNYRYQALGGQGKELSFAPRFSLILPSGDENQGLGNGTIGYQILLPVSKEFECCSFHFNAGTTVTPNVRAGVDPLLGLAGQTLNGYLLGGSGIYFLRPNVNLLVETLALWDESLTDAGNRDRSFQLFLNPGVRWAPYTKDDVQWVLGLGAPIGLTRDTPDFSLFLYLSLEHPITIAPRAKDKAGAAQDNDRAGL